MVRKIQKLPPVGIVRSIEAVRNLLLTLHRRLFPGNVVLYEHLQSFWLLPSIYVAAKLNIAGLLEERALSPAEIAHRLNTDPESTNRLMRALSGQGIFTLQSDGKYRLTRISRALTDRQGSLRYAILHHLGAVNWNLMSNLEYSVRTGNDAFLHMYGTDVYEYLKHHPAEYDLFDKSMSNLSDLGLSPILNAYNFGKHRMIADIGGGEGFLLTNILHHFNVPQGILFDQPGDRLPMDRVTSHPDIVNKIRIVEGSFFDAIPDGADLYILKNVIHNWNDTQAVEILANIRKVLTVDARIMIIEMVVPAGDQPSLAKLLDIQMLATTKGGKERTAAEFSELLNKADLTLSGIIPTIAPVCLIEARIK